jgi:hypothetical protein
MVKIEREAYATKRNLAAERPSEYMSDGADQKVYQIPHFNYKTKLNQCFPHLLANGVLDHSGKAFIFTAFKNISHDSNFTIECLQRTLENLEKEGENNFKFPPKLFLQMDNCWRENKNKFVMAYLSLLVHRKIFKEIEISFIPVGHTHEDIDQLFGTISSMLKSRTAVTLKSFQRLVERSTQNNPKIKAIQIGKVANFSGLMKRYLKDFQGISKFRFFRITSDPELNVCLTVKEELTDPYWRGVFEGRPVYLFNSGVDFNRILEETPTYYFKSFDETLVKAYKNKVDQSNLISARKKEKLDNVMKNIY